MIEKKPSIETRKCIFFPPATVSYNEENFVTKTRKRVFQSIRLVNDILIKIVEVVKCIITSERS